MPRCLLRSVLTVGCLAAACNGDAPGIQPFHISEPVGVRQISVPGITVSNLSGMLEFPKPPVIPYVVVDSLRQGIVRAGRSASAGDLAYLYAAGVHEADWEDIWQKATRTVPYWASLAVPVVGRGALYDVVGINLRYPLYIVRGGAVVDSITDAGPSWNEAPLPTPGQFADTTAGRLNRYLNQRTIITGIAVLAADAIIVNQGQYHPTQTHRLARTHTVLKVYVKGRLIAELPSPGELLAYNGDSVFFLTRDSKRLITIIEYRWRNTNELIN